MSEINELIHTTASIAYRRGLEDSKQKIVRHLENYFVITQEPGDDGKVTDNPEWDAGFQAAMALIKGM